MRYLPMAAFLGLSLLWGSGWILASSLPAQPRLCALALQYGVSAVLLLPWVIRRRLWRKPLRSVVHVVIIGTGILCLPQILIFASNGKLSPVLPLVALATVPVLLAIGGRLTISTAVCGLAGILFLVDQGLDISMRQSLWLLFPLAAACVLACALAGAEKHMQEISIVEALFAQCAVSVPLLWIASQLLEHEALTWSATAAIGFIVNAVLTTICGYLLFYWLLSKFGAGRMSMLQWMQPLVATAESIVLLHTKPDWTVIAGAILIVIAILWAFSNRDEEGEYSLRLLKVRDPQSIVRIS
jgi:drug/metabolite transporter (DMT)-like permease